MFLNLVLTYNRIHHSTLTLNAWMLLILYYHEPINESICIRQVQWEQFSERIVTWEQKAGKILTLTDFILLPNILSISSENSLTSSLPSTSSILRMGSTSLSFYGGKLFQILFSMFSELIHDSSVIDIITQILNVIHSDFLSGLGEGNLT